MHFWHRILICSLEITAALCKDCDSTLKNVTTISVHIFLWFIIVSCNLDSWKSVVLTRRKQKLVNSILSVRLWYYVFEHGYGSFSVLMMVCDIQKHFFFYFWDRAISIMWEWKQSWLPYFLTQYNTLDNGWSAKEESVWMVVVFIPRDLHSSSHLVFTNVNVCLVPLSKSVSLWHSYQYTFFQYAQYNFWCEQLCEICLKICCCVITLDEATWLNQ